MTAHRMLLVITLLIAASSLAACSPGDKSASTPNTTKSSAFACNNAQWQSDQQGFASGQITGDQFVNVCGTVTAVLAEKDTRSGHHGYFDLHVAPGQTIEIVSDLDQMNAPAWPWVKVGDDAYVQGRYYYDSASSQGIDWTHHGTSNAWPHAGYVVINGTQYQ